MALSRDELETFKRTLGEIDKIISIASASAESTNDDMLAEVIAKCGHTIAVLGLFRDDLILVKAPSELVGQVEDRLKTMSMLYASIVLRRPDIYGQVVNNQKRDNTPSANKMYDEYEDMFAKAIAANDGQ